MSKVPQVEEIWKDKYDGHLVRIYRTTDDFVIFFEFEESSGNIVINTLSRIAFMKIFIFEGNGKPIDVLFEVIDE